MTWWRNLYYSESYPFEIYLNEFEALLDSFNMRFPKYTSKIYYNILLFFIVLGIKFIVYIRCESDIENLKILNISLAQTICKIYYHSENDINVFSLDVL